LHGLTNDQPKVDHHKCVRNEYKIPEAFIEDFTDEEKNCFLNSLKRVAHKAENDIDGMVKHD
jgi:hypothetical protein